MGDQLNGVKVGDRIKCARKFGRVEELFVVSDVTKSLAKCACGASFRIDNGLMSGTGGGSSWDRRNGYLVDGEALARVELAIRIRAAQEKISALTVTPENIEAVESLLKARKP